MILLETLFLFCITYYDIWYIRWKNISIIYPNYRDKTWQLLFLLHAFSYLFMFLLQSTPHDLIAFIIQQPRKTIDKHKTTETCLIHTLCFIILGILGDVDYPSTNISLSSTTIINYIYLPPEFTNEVTLICFRCNMHTLFKWKTYYS